MFMNRYYVMLKEISYIQTYYRVIPGSVVNVRHIFLIDILNMNASLFVYHALTTHLIIMKPCTHDSRLSFIIIPLIPKKYTGIDRD